MTAPAPATGVAQHSVVSVNRLSKVYGSVSVVDEMTFALQPGTITGFLGPNGAGKSTTMRMLLGLTRPAAGEALIDGRPYAALERPAEVVGAVLESTDFNPGRSGRDHLRVLATQAGFRHERVDEVLATVGLTKASRKLVKGYSLGMRQRLGLAGALLGQPRILILDEPANGLDPAGVHWLRSLLQDFAAAGGTVLVSSHLLAELAQTIDHVLIVVDGRLRADTDMNSLHAQGRGLEAAYLELTAGSVSQ
jgi:ABC-2 type transport system ATP-binding protein